MNGYEVLVAARAKIADPSHWMKGALAYDAMGQGVMASDKSACQFCSVGALVAVALSDCQTYYAEAEDALREAIAEMYGMSSIVQFNDAETTTHEMVMKVFDRAIAAEEAKHE